MGKYKLNRASEKLDQSFDNPAYSGSRSHLWTEGSDFAQRGTAKKRIAWIAIAVIVVVAIVVAITLAVVLRDDGDDKDDATSTSTSTTSPPTAEWLSQPCFSKQTLPKCPWSNNPLLLVSLDGFRAEYVLRNYTPVIQKLRSCGVHTPYMRAVYPTLTFPNHYTIVTGLYPESHDVVGNRMYDPVINESFSLGSEQKLNPAWYGGEPIWITAKKQGRRTAAYFWPGSDVNISGIYPDEWHLYNGSVTYEERVDAVLDWLRLPGGQRPDFMTVYISEPDKQGHSSGPDSEEINEMLRKVDAVVGRLMNGLHDQRIEHCVNLVITADHGMSKQSCSQAVFVKNYSPDMSDMLMQHGPTGNVFPQYVYNDGVTSNRPDDIDLEVFVNNLTCRHPAMKVFTKSTIPRRHHFSNSRRIGDVMLLMADEWNVFRTELGFCTGGNHGWDELYKNMHALFLAHGPAFKENFTTEPFENIELYNMMCDILDITPAANNGTAGRLSDILKYPKSVTNIPTIDYDTCNHPGDRLNSCYCSSDFTMSPSGVYLNASNDVLYFGEPRLVMNDSACVLYQEGFSVGYSQTSMSPVWLATTVTTSQKAVDFNTNSSCVLQDTRVSTECPPSVDKDGMELTSLGGLGIDNDPETASLSSTLVPMYTEFKNGVWQAVLGLLDDYVTRFGSLSVTMGTIYDYNDDSVWEGKINDTKYADSANVLPIPTHIYIIIIKCQTTGEQLPCNNDVDVLSFVLPHLTSPTNCMTMASYLQDNMARIRDIELLTGLQFLTDVKPNLAVHLRTFLPEDIWPSSMFPEWVDLPCPQEDLCQQDYKPLLLVSLDGFRADYLIRNFTPTIARLSQCGAHAPFMRTVYPTKTFPSHYSIVTGLYPESHGIVDNFMYDVDIKKTFTLGGSETFKGRWWGGEPIWVTAQKQGLKAASYFWTGSDANVSGVFPETYRVYDGSATYTGRVQDVLSWFLRSRDQRPDFVTLYFDEPDLAGHRYGPSNEEGIADALEKVDKTINELMTGLVRFNLHHCVNLVIIADHGMEDVNCTREVLLSDYVDSRYLSSNFWVWDGTVGRIANTYIFNSSVPGSIAPAQNPEPVDEIVANLTCASPDINVYTPSSMPIRYHYSNNDRIGEVLIDVAPGATVRRRPSPSCRLGRHGYDNIYKSMEALFLAYGPAFKWNYTMEPFESIELYNLFTDVLNITASPNNGTAGSLSHILHKVPEASPTTPKAPDNQLVDALELYKQRGDYAGVEERYCNGSCDDPSKVEDIYRSLCCPQNGSDDLPFGLPAVVSSDMSSRNLTYMYHEDHVTLFDVDIGKEIWTTRTFLKSETTSVMEAFKDSASQLAPDLTQNAALRGIIDALAEMAFNWLTSYEQLNLFTGYGYDKNHDSLPDTHISSDTLPTHFYIVFATCKTRDSLLKDCEDIIVSSYIVPRHDGTQTCKPAEDYLVDVEARVRDVEILSGFELFTAVPARQAVRVRTFLPQRP